MAEMGDKDVQELLTGPNFGVVSSHNPNGTILSTVIWVGYCDGELSINTAAGRPWCRNVERNPNLTVLVTDRENGNRFVEIRGTAVVTAEGAVDHVQAVARKYTGRDYTWPTGREKQRLKFIVTPEKIRYFSAPR
jgi:PPOX class probable F420-dependent enzyme